MRARRQLRLWLAATGVAGVVATLPVLSMPVAGAVSFPSCGTPVVTAPAYAQGSTSTITWTATGTQGSGLIAEVSLTPDFSQAEQSIGDIPADATSYTFSGLSEARHYYHVRTKTLSGVCSAGGWSNPVSTIQDSTPPVVTVATPQSGDVETGTSVTVTGTLTDPPAGTTPSGSGPASVSVTLTQLTSGSSTTQHQATTGPWSVVFSNLDRGVYTVSVTGYDQVGNATTTPPRPVIVVGAPSTLSGTLSGTQDWTDGFPQSPFSTMSLAGVYQGSPVQGSYDCSRTRDWWDGGNPFPSIVGSPYCTLQAASVGSPPAVIDISWTAQQYWLPENAFAWEATGTTSAGGSVFCGGTITNPGFQQSVMAGECIISG